MIRRGWSSSGAWLLVGRGGVVSGRRALAMAKSVDSGRIGRDSMVRWGGSQIRRRHRWWWLDNNDRVSASAVRMLMGGDRVLVFTGDRQTKSANYVLYQLGFKIGLDWLDSANSLSAFGQKRFSPILIRFYT